MNTYLKNIFEQPQELEKVYRDLTGQHTKLAEIAGYLQIASRIVLTSMGSAYYSLMPMYYELKKQGKNVDLVESAELLFRPELVDKNALYILMSRSGESGEVATLSGILRDEGCISVAITMTPDSAMAKHASIVLHDTASYDDLICTKAYTTLALSGLLCTAWMNRPGLDSEAERALLNMFCWMDANKKAILDQYADTGFLDAASSYYFLSRGYGLGVVQSASLWLEETAKTPGSVLSLDNYYHGSIELSSGNIIPVFLDGYPDERSSMIWSRICEFAAHSICITPRKDLDTGSLVFHSPVFALSESYHMILQSLYFQLLAYQNALVRGIEPGTMSTLSWVVK